jgi:predicted acylesterase/phospholipase RssA
MYHASNDKSKFEYDFFTGVSAGSINSGAISAFEKGDEERMLQILSDTWASLDTSNLYRQWEPLGMVSGI